MGVSWKWPQITFYISISIIAYLIFLVITQSEQICKLGIEYVHLVTTDHMGSTCSHHCPHIKSHQCSPYRTLDIWFFLLANQNRYANEVLNMWIWWWQTTWVVLVPITTHIPSSINVSHTGLWIFDFFVISQSEKICKWSTKYAHQWRQTTWVVLVSITTHIPSFINIAHKDLWIFDFFVISQSEQLCKWRIRYGHLVTTNHLGITTHTKFHQCSPYRTLDIWLFCYTPIRTDMQMRY